MSCEQDLVHAASTWSCDGDDADDDDDDDAEDFGFTSAVPTRARQVYKRSKSTSGLDGELKLRKRKSMPS